MESFNQGKSASQILNDAMIETGKTAANIDSMENAVEFINNFENSSPNQKAFPAVNLAAPSPDLLAPVVRNATITPIF